MKFFKYGTIVGVIVILTVLGNFIFKTIYYGHSTDLELYKEYLWIFKESHKKDIDSFGYSYYKKNDVCNIFHYKGDLKNFDMGYCVSVWEFKNLGEIKLKNVSIGTKKDLFNVFFEEGETLDKDSGLDIDVKDGFSFESGFNVNIDKKDTINSFYNNLKYKGFYGNFRKISLSDGKGQQQIVLHNNLSSTLTSLVVYKKLNSRPLKSQFSWQSNY